MSRKAWLFFLAQEIAQGGSDMVAEPAAARSVTPQGGTDKTILIVEDNPVDREWLTLVLRRAGYDVVVSGHGQQALDYLHSKPAPHLILLDMFLPVLDGWHFLDRLREELPDKSVPVVVATATILTQEWADEHRCAGFLRKPIEEDVLLREVARCIMQSK
jgi:CheY-like chemotaxis protein